MTKDFEQPPYFGGYKKPQPQPEPAPVETPDGQEKK
jgi:hypothetical protein